MSNYPDGFTQADHDRAFDDDSGERCPTCRRAPCDCDRQFDEWRDKNPAQDDFGGAFDYPLVG